MSTSTHRLALTELVTVLHFVKLARRSNASLIIKHIHIFMVDDIDWNTFNPRRPQGRALLNNTVVCYWSDVHHDRMRMLIRPSSTTSVTMSRAQSIQLLTDACVVVVPGTDER